MSSSGTYADACALAADGAARHAAATTTRVARDELFTYTTERDAPGE